MTNRIGELTKAKEALERQILNLETDAHNSKMERLELDTQLLIVVSEKSQRSYEYN